MGQFRQIPWKIPCLQGIWPETGAISTASPARHSCGLREFTTCASQARKSGLFVCSAWSPGSRSLNLPGESAESLRHIPEKFPFWGNYWRRLVRSRLPLEGNSCLCCFTRLRANGYRWATGRRWSVARCRCNQSTDGGTLELTGSCRSNVVDF